MAEDAKPGETAGATTQRVEHQEVEHQTIHDPAARTDTIAGTGAQVQKDEQAPTDRPRNDGPAGGQPVGLRDRDTPSPQPIEGAPIQQGTPTAGLSQSPGLRELPDSQVPGLAGGGMVSHVFGPGQSPVDPIAAGLDTGYNPLTRAENRVITQTGTLGAGARPSTYAHIGGEPVPQAGPSDHANVPAVSDEEAGRAPGPNSAGGDAATINPHE